VETLTGQGSQASLGSRKGADSTSNQASKSSGEAVREEKGRLSNPVQRRLSNVDLDEIVLSHRNGASIDSLACRFGVHRTTILHHLDRRGVPRPPATRKMTDRTVRQAATSYRKGESLKAVAGRFGVNAGTLAREFTRAGVPIRPRPGWPSAG